MRKLARRIGARLNATGLLGNSSHCIPVAYNYRVHPDGSVAYRFGSSGGGLKYELRRQNGGDELSEPVAGCEICEIVEGDILEVNLLDLSIRLNQKSIVPGTRGAASGRKFVARLHLKLKDGIHVRHCVHYFPFENKAITKDYYFGDDYTDYPNQTAPDHAVELVQQFVKEGRLLDVGCALGIYTKAFLDHGFDSFGVDVSSYAVEEAKRRLGASRAALARFESDDIPFQGKFEVIWCWDVLEHFHDPKEALAILSERASPGAHIFLHTSNADSLTHQIFKSDWEGYTDYSHYGVDKITNKSLSAWLNELGWQVLDWKCTNLWIRGTDEIVGHLNTLFHQDDAFRTLVRERGLGDFITVVARRKS